MSDEDSTEEIITLAKTRTRRVNAGARMSEMIAAAEQEEMFAKTYGAIRSDDESSEDEEYIPKEFEGANGEAGRNDNDEGDDDDDEEESSSDDKDDSSNEESDNNEDENDIEDLDESNNICNKTANFDLDNVKNETDSLIDSILKPEEKQKFLKGQLQLPNDVLIRLASANTSSHSNKTQHAQAIQTGSPHKSTYPPLAKICCVCLNSQIDEDDEIIECDSCGVPVHESCYGVNEDDQDEVLANKSSNKSSPNNKCTKKENKNLADSKADTESVHSSMSSESTEPWFCEPCKRSVRNPSCELCPNFGGIFKETDTGRWVHMVCALYTHGVTFENVRNLTKVSLFEINYSLWGSKVCTICEDRRLARSGICIECDAGLCKTFFHVTCAQKEGLLFESHSDEVDPYFAQCKQHAEKAIINKKKRKCTVLHSKLKKIQPGMLYVDNDRVKRKLLEYTSQSDPLLTRWNENNRPPIPFKVSRMLLTSPSLILKLNKKSELSGLDPSSSFMSIQDEIEMARQKWHIPPKFDLEFVAYVLDRNNRMKSMNKHNSELMKQNAALKSQEAKLREKYDNLKAILDAIRRDTDVKVKQARSLQQLVSSETGKPYNLPIALEQLIARTINTKKHTVPDQQSKPMKSAPKSQGSHSEDFAPAKNNQQQQSSYPNCGEVGSSSKKSSTSQSSLLQTNQKSSHKQQPHHPVITTHNCEKCESNQDQHLLSLCDTCSNYFHIYCLDPPLTRVPKKSKFGGWQCSDCSEKDDEDQEEALEERNEIAFYDKDGPRRLRERIKFPEKYSHESMMLANFWSQNKAKKSSKKSGKKKKPKLDVQVKNEPVDTNFDDGFDEEENDNNDCGEDLILQSEL